MTARELLRHCFSWEIAPGIAAPEEDAVPEEAPDAEHGTEVAAGTTEAGHARTG
jgi:hypothetical protein